MLFDDQYILFYTSFAFFPTERPIALTVTVDGERALFVPRLEGDHARQVSQAEHVESYREFPDERHPLLQLADVLTNLGLRFAPIGLNHDVTRRSWGTWDLCCPRCCPARDVTVRIAR
ncbi:aminopeptidase P family N-terminal domain-containing protein [Deinococcus yavapaiensis]|uniref:Uncharacterized protein n=1 Tax=Deinococcus yavapaiensis KR-236 TaxID=694435 RepID=A0A318S0Q4_9DEIO|nr:aminopeptidase P family N-terminal domain-containing protein [Deinococcus yavapaiensis]PYE50555.1 hypothetical protein DES52_11773 [Deinococcus yavapaiensis KR-236]